MKRHSRSRFGLARPRLALASHLGSVSPVPFRSSPWRLHTGHVHTLSAGALTTYAIFPMSKFLFATMTSFQMPFHTALEKRKRSVADNKLPENAHLKLHDCLQSHPYLLKFYFLLNKPFPSRFFSLLSFSSLLILALRLPSATVWP